ncbi:MAG: ROK family protein, partial [Xanthomonadales bacterium]|nr:ROK family protein [Xanthomonadales bacterium]
MARTLTKRRQDLNVLVIDVGGSHVKVLATGQAERRLMVSGPELKAGAMAAGVKALAESWPYDVVSIGYPGMVVAD